MRNQNQYITLFTTASIILLFALQTIFIYKLYWTNKRTIENELNIGLDHAYLDGLYIRLDLDRKKKKTSSLRKDSVALLLNKSSVSDSLISNLVGDVEDRLVLSYPKIRRTAEENLKLEESLNNDYPFSFKALDQFLTSLFLISDENLLYNLVYFNPKNNHVYATSNPVFEDRFIMYHSKTIYLDKEHTKAIMIKALPSDPFVLYFLCFLFISLVFTLFCCYNFYYQTKLSEKQEQLRTVKNRFFSEVSHELIRSLSLLSQSIDSLKIEDNILNTEKRTRYLSYADQEISKMAKKTEMALSLAREDEGIFELNIKEFDFVKVVYDEVDTILAVPVKNIDVDIDVDNSFLVNGMIHGDKDHLEQAVSNLISNAVKYSGDYLDLKIRLWREDQNVFISVKDNGFGISIKDQIVIFERYTRVDQHANLKGHGIGLSYVKRIVEKHKGEINLISKLGEGSEFIIRLPQ